MNNPCGLDGVDFVEYTGPAALQTGVPAAQHFADLFARWGFKKISAVPGKNLELYRQNDINFIVNTEPNTFASGFAKLHGPSICSTGFRLDDAEKALATAVERGAKPYQGSDAEKGASPFPAVYGIGDSLIYFIDKKNARKLYTEIFKIADQDLNPKGVGFEFIDHFTNNVPKGEMQKWCDFYTNIFGFRETRYFDIRGKSTGLISKVMRSPDGKFAVPINEPSDTKSQIQEYLDEYKGSGIQHVAFLTSDIVSTLKELRTKQIEFLTPPPQTYYEMLQDRVPNVSEDIKTLQKEAILVDGDHDGYLLQIFSKNLIGPIFYEVIQRKGHSGFGDGNFQALFDAIERDQKERGYL